jgi:hypothetical protein
MLRWPVQTLPETATLQAALASGRMAMGVRVSSTMRGPICRRVRKMGTIIMVPVTKEV